MRTGKTTTALNLRSQPNTQSSILMILSAFMTVHIVSEEGDWLKVSVGNQEGFVHQDFVQIDPDEETADIDTSNNSWPKRKKLGEFDKFKEGIYY